MLAYCFTYLPSHQMFKSNIIYIYDYDYSLANIHLTLVKQDTRIIMWLAIPIFTCYVGTSRYRYSMATIWLYG